MRKFTLFLNTLFLFVCSTIFAIEPKSEPKYSYQNAIRESLFVDMPGENISIALDVIRPKETDENLLVPTILVASPYNEFLGRGPEGETKKYDENDEIIRFPLFYDNYFVPRGYAVVHVDIIGTNRSKGCPDIGGTKDIESAKVVVDWLMGKTTARDLKNRARYATWSNKKVGMIGKSYDGSIANGLASTGIEGLITIVPICAVSSWYDWVFLNGIKDMKSMAGLFDMITTRDTRNLCIDARNEMVEGPDYSKSLYNSFWDERNYVKNSDGVKASVFLVHGLRDYNVRMQHLYKWWEGLSKINASRKLWLSQSAHVDPFDFRREKWVTAIHKWFDYWLLDIENGVMNEAMVDIEEEPGVWQTYDSWPDNDAHAIDIFFTMKDGKGELKSNPSLPGTIESYTVSALKKETLSFLSSPLKATCRFSGCTEIWLRAKVNQPQTDIGIFLMDYGPHTVAENQKNKREKECFGESSDFDTACYPKVEMVTHEKDVLLIDYAVLDTKHWRSIERVDDLIPDEWYSFYFATLSTDHVFKEGHRLGVMVKRADDMKPAPPNPITVTVDLSQSKLTLPLICVENPFELE